MEEEEGIKIEQDNYSVHFYWQEALYLVTSECLRSVRAARNLRSSSIVSCFTMTL